MEECADFDYICVLHACLTWNTKVQLYFIRWQKPTTHPCGYKINLLEKYAPKSSMHDKLPTSYRNLGQRMLACWQLTTTLRAKIRALIDEVFFNWELHNMYVWTYQLGSKTGEKGYNEIYTPQERNRNITHNWYRILAKWTTLFQLEDQ